MVVVLTSIKLVITLSGLMMTVLAGITLMMPLPKLILVVSDASA